MREKQLSNREIAESLFIVNRHAKTAPEPKHLYEIKKSTITKLLKERRAKKIGLHFSDHPKLSKQHSTLLIEVGGYYFHIPAEKKDFNQLKHLGKVDQSYRNPKPKLSLSRAKRTLYNYLGWDHEKAPTSYSPSSHPNLSMLGQQHIAPWNQRPKR
ncbi:YkyB family protein [Halobacillus hunanensis]|uniref:YkyB family protein n=1 Tax=Halobacillus hunanensis TaxID=578214 RepID=UPI0009A83D2B|nr:YkyB family protein [Halobacillus hunanensis]